jgi:hypothetical protein
MAIRVLVQPTTEVAVTTEPCSSMDRSPLRVFEETEHAEGEGAKATRAHAMDGFFVRDHRSSRGSTGSHVRPNRQQARASGRYLIPDATGRTDNP